MNRACFGVILLLFLVAGGCGLPKEQLTFPYRPLHASPEAQWFDMNGDGKNDFAVTFGDDDRLDALCYDDNQDGKPDRVYHLRDYDNVAVPHAIIMLDSVPFDCVAERYKAGEFRWFAPPAKVIGPFPTLTEICYTDLLHAAPMPGMIDQFYDPETRSTHNGLFSRTTGQLEYPWERYVDYRAPFIDEPFAYLDPLPWYHTELERAHATINASPERVTLVYLTTASGTICKYGREGVDQVMDGAARLCLQLLYERHGAIRISLLADHGHNLQVSENIHIDEVLKKAGFKPAKRLDEPSDVVLEMNGLVTYAAVWTSQPQSVAAALLKHPAIDMTMFMLGSDVVVRTPEGESTISCRDGKLAYTVGSHDVLGYGIVLDALKASGKLDADGYATRADWFAATADHHYPDAPARLWDAFHRQVINPPSVMFTTRNGYMAGLDLFDSFTTMKSSHGSLDQINTATFVMTTGPEQLHTMRIDEVMHAIEPTWTPGVARSRK